MTDIDEVLESYAKYQYQLYVDNDGSRQLNKREAKERLSTIFEQMIDEVDNILLIKGEDDRIVSWKNTEIYKSIKGYTE